MQIKPDDNWRWYCDEESDRMMLDLANGMLFRSRFARRMIDARCLLTFRILCRRCRTVFLFFEEKCRDIELSKSSARN